jgi:hypothetical protein
MSAQVHTKNHKKTKMHINKIAGTCTGPERDCEDYYEEFFILTELASHKLASKHLDKVASINKNKYLGRPRCVICDMTLEKESTLAKHNLTKKHIDKAAAAAKSIESCS